ncbi:MAG: hypothetical protein K6U87_06090 [Firmicutes bacterium]|nr:hypothetical protein [Bacillota bacterium]
MSLASAVVRWVVEGLGVVRVFGSPEALAAAWDLVPAAAELIWGDVVRSGGGPGPVHGGRATRLEVADAP